MPQKINFQPIFDYIDEKVDPLAEDIKALNLRVDTLQTSIDGLAKMVRDFRDEHIVMHRRLEVLERWAQKVSQKTGVPLPL